MKKIIFVICASLFFIGCASDAPKVSDTPISETKTASEKEKETVAAHSVDKEAEINKTAPSIPPVERSKDKGKWTRSGDPIDVSKYNAAIEKAEAALKAKPEDAAAKKSVAEAFYDRGFALTQARQYAAAIGDYRKALKHVPDHQDSKKWVSQITMIYKSLNREIPAEGEEPEPLEFEKQKA